MAGRLERVLRERNAFIGLDSECDCHLDALYACVEGAMLKVSGGVINTRNDSFYTTANVSHAGQNMYCTETDSKIYRFCMIARNVVASDAAKIQKSRFLRLTSERDKIDSLFHWFNSRNPRYWTNTFGTRRLHALPLLC